MINSIIVYCLSLGFSQNLCFEAVSMYADCAIVKSRVYSDREIQLIKMECSNEVKKSLLEFRYK